MFFGFEVSLVSGVFSISEEPVPPPEGHVPGRRRFFGIVGHQPHVSNPKHVEHLGSHTIIPQIFLESKPVVGFHRIDPIFLKLIGFQFIEQGQFHVLPGKIKDHPFSFTFDHHHRHAIGVHSHSEMSQIHHQSGIPNGPGPIPVHPFPTLL